MEQQLQQLATAVDKLLNVSLHRFIFAETSEEIEAHLHCVRAVICNQTFSWLLRFAFMHKDSASIILI